MIRLLGAGHAQFMIFMNSFCLANRIIIFGDLGTQMNTKRVYL